MQINRFGSVWEFLVDKYAQRSGIREEGGTNVC